ncbi:MAG: BtaA family protein [Parachlamydia sp.]|nr:BtaA family protein [Parachlamydia sp.]
MTPFFSRLSYSFGNEDWRTELQALRIAPGNRVLCITASGDRPLHLLLDPCDALVSVDANQVQNHLLQLKRTAMEHLDFEDYLAFLGGSFSSSRGTIFQRLTPYMDPGAAAHWTKHLKMVEKGILFQGTTERFVKLANIVFCWRRKEIQGLFACRTLEEQRAFLQKNWRHDRWKRIFKWSLKPFLTRFALQDPGMYSHLDNSMEPGLYIYERMMHSFDQTLARENALASLILLQTINEEAFPPYLKPEGYQIIKPRLNRLTAITQDIISYLEDIPEKSFDRFSMSDISSYLDRPSFEKLLRAIYRTARPGARFCLRQLMSRYTIPEDLGPHFTREKDLEKKLEFEDRAFLYHFTVGTINKS